jgi:hypothetical protein
MPSAKKKSSPKSRGPSSKGTRQKGSTPGSKGKHSEKKDIVWTDEYDFDYTLNELTEEIVFLRKIKVAYEKLMFQYKVSAKDIANVTHKAKYAGVAE